jgi:hypothetical protein
MTDQFNPLPVVRLTDLGVTGLTAPKWNYVDAGAKVFSQLINRRKIARLLDSQFFAHKP